MFTALPRGLRVGGESFGQSYRRSSGEVLRPPPNIGHFHKPVVVFLGADDESNVKTSQCSRREGWRRPVPETKKTENLITFFRSGPHTATGCMPPALSRKRSIASPLRSDRRCRAFHISRLVTREKRPYRPIPGLSQGTKIGLPYHRWFGSGVIRGPFGVDRTNGRIN